MGQQKGQAIVEFAFVLPFFLFLVFGIIYFGFLFKDYMTLSNVARSSAREAALGTDYDTVKDYYKDSTQLSTGVYTWSGEGDSFTIEKITNGEDGNVSGSVKVTIKATLNTDFPAYGLMRQVSFPSEYKIQYSMHDETAGT
ncbi:MAG: pilus assembly protein [Selenomonadaceae bacterium]|nr:pilus assembly protein [Selenomonadaceae bacterium]